MSKATTFGLVLFAMLSTSSPAQTLGGPCPTFNSTVHAIATRSRDLFQAEVEQMVGTEFIAQKVIEKLVELVGFEPTTSLLRTMISFFKRTV